MSAGYYNPECKKEENDAIAIANAKARAFALNINYNILVDPILSNTEFKDSITEPKQLKDLVSPENLMSKFFGNDENESIAAAGSKAESEAKIKNNNINIVIKY